MRGSLPAGGGKLIRKQHPAQWVQRRKLLCALVAYAFAGSALANPNGPAVVNGTANFATAGKSLTVTNTPNAIINWQAFSIGAGESTRFVQQSASSSVLNRVVGQDPSAILGTLRSNGRVFLLNPNGILFGAGSRVDVAGLVASTLNLSNQDFLAGRLSFESGAAANSIVNHGSIVTPVGGRIEITGEEVALNGNARVEATGRQGGGTVLVGGDYQGKNPEVPNARTTFVGRDAVIDASATDAGDGGRVVVWSDQTTKYYGS